MIETAKKKIYSDGGSNNNSFQSYVESLIKTREILIATTNKAGISKIQTIDNAERLSSRIATLLHQDNISSAQQTS